MFDYAVCQLNGKQYKVIPGKAFEVEVGPTVTGEIDVPLIMRVSGGKIDMGNPLLKDKIKLKVLNNFFRKIRVSKFHAKANYRKTTGSKYNLAQVIFEPVKKES